MKTEMCKFFLSNRCGKGARCAFAHSLSEIREKPDLMKTSMCRDFLQTGNCDRPGCTFAHDERELRTTAGFFKTKLCRFAASGRCKHGNSCRFAHTPDELAPEAQRSDHFDDGASGQSPPRLQGRAPSISGAFSVSDGPGHGYGSDQGATETWGEITSDQSTRDIASDQSTRAETSASVPTPEGSGDSGQEDPGRSGAHRRGPSGAGRVERRPGSERLPGRHCTTLMLTNVPNFLTQGALVSLLEDLTVCVRGAFDFFYCPWDPYQDLNLGYAIINFFSRSVACEFEREWANQPLLPRTHGTKRLRIVPAALQGRAANLRHFSGFTLAHHADPRFRPLVRAAPNEALRPMAISEELVRNSAPPQGQQQQAQPQQPQAGAGGGGGRGNAGGEGTYYHQQTHQAHFQHPTQAAARQKEGSRQQPQHHQQQHQPQHPQPQQQQPQQAPLNQQQQQQQQQQQLQLQYQHLQSLQQQLQQQQQQLQQQQQAQQQQQQQQQAASASQQQQQQQQQQQAAQQQQQQQQQQEWGCAASSREEAFYRQLLSAANGVIGAMGYPGNQQMEQAPMKRGGGSHSGQMQQGGRQGASASISAAALWGGLAPNGAAANGGQYVLMSQPPTPSGPMSMPLGSDPTGELLEQLGKVQNTGLAEDMAGMQPCWALVSLPQGGGHGHGHDLGSSDHMSQATLGAMGALPCYTNGLSTAGLAYIPQLGALSPQMAPANFRGHADKSYHPGQGRMLDDGH